MSMLSRFLPRAATSLSRSSSTRLGGSFRFASSLTYTKEHEWILSDPDSDTVTVGVADYAQKNLGRVVFVDLSEVGLQVTKGDTIGMVESTKTASDIYSPVSGTIVEINEDLLDQVSLLNKSPEDEGWAVKIKISDRKELDDSLSKEEYKKITGE